jgi:hypothetical protein
MPYDCIDLNLRLKRIPYFSLVDKQSEKKKIKKKLLQFNKYLQTMGLCFEKISVSPDNQNNDFKLEMKRTESIQTESTKTICQNIKDIGLISDRTYKKLRETLKPIVRLSSLQTCYTYKKKVDNIWPISENAFGSFVADPKSKIEFMCHKYLEKLDQPFNGSVFNILLSDDSFNVTKTQINALNFTFSLLKDGDLSHNGFYVLGKIKIY